jgi:hypothetical protein
MAIVGRTPGSSDRLPITRAAFNREMHVAADPIKMISTVKAMLKFTVAVAACPAGIPLGLVITSHCRARSPQSSNNTVAMKTARIPSIPALRTIRVQVQTGRKKFTALTAIPLATIRQESQ